MQSDGHLAIAMIDRDYERVPSTMWLRLFYSATFLGLVSLTTLYTLGLSFMFVFGQSPLWPMMFIAFPVVMWRLYLVWQYPTTLTRVRSSGLRTLFWAIAIAMIVVGWLAILVSVLRLLPWELQLVQALRIGVSGLLLFEWTRLIGFEGAYRCTTTMDVPENEPEPAVWLNVVALAALLMLLGTQIVELVAYTVTEAGKPWSWFSTSDGRFHLGPSSSSLLGLILALPTALLVAARIVTLVRHRKEIPLPKSTGALRAVRKIALAGLVVYVLAVVASTIGEIHGDASGMIGKAVPRYVPLLFMLLGPVFLVVLEGSRLLAYERLERPELE